jgi:DNA-binding GntR family transcriptional regulator
MQLLSLAGYLIMNSPAEIPVIARQSERLGELIEERIVTGAYPPGTRLDEQELATTFGVSRTPVREALIQLASIGLIEIRPRRGATVPEVGADRVCEMFEVMAELEAMCGRLAARRITASEQLALQEAHRACEAARDADTPDVYYQLNEVFHQRIYEASHKQLPGRTGHRPAPPPASLSPPATARPQPDGNVVQRTSGDCRSHHQGR